MATQSLKSLGSKLPMRGPRKTDLVRGAEHFTKLTRRINACRTSKELHSELNSAAAIWERVSRLARYEDHDFWDFLGIDPDELSDRVIERDFPVRPASVVDQVSDLYPHWIAWGRSGLLIEAEDIRKNQISLIEPWPTILDKLEMHLLD